MKRTNVILDEELLEEARKASGERTYSAAISKALKEYVRVNHFRQAIDEMNDTADGFAPGYLEWYYATHRIDDSMMPKVKKRISASRRRLPAKGVKRHGSR